MPTLITFGAMSARGFGWTKSKIPIVVTNIGAVASASPVSSVAISSVNVPAGALIFLGVAEGDTNGTMGTVSDSVNGAWTLSGTAQKLGGSNFNGAGNFFYKENSAAISGGTITYTCADVDSAAITAFYVTGVKTSGALDSAVTAAMTAGNNSAAPFSLTSGTPSVAGELMVALVADEVGFSPPWYTQDTGNGWATPPVGVDCPFGARSPAGIHGGSQVNTGTGTKTFAPTNSNSGGNTGSYAVWIIGFKPA